MRADDLAALVLDNDGNATDEFHWCHHTFTHQNMDNITLYDARKQIKYNIQMAVRGVKSGVKFGMKFGTSVVSFSKFRRWVVPERRLLVRTRCHASLPRVLQPWGRRPFAHVPALRAAGALAPTHAVRTLLSLFRPRWAWLASPRSVQSAWSRLRCAPPP